MAANEITFKVKVTKDGSLKVVAKDAEKAAKGTEKLGKSTEQTTKARDRFNRGEKGVAQAGMNTTKSFSKMRDVMGGGSSGLVGAYATLAANVFALTAAFGILQRAAAAQQLAEGLAYTGQVAGRNLPYIADQLKEITGSAVSTQEAMTAVATATAAGFSSSQIADLGEVAKGASLALGRDMTDALNRLIRGSAKLEPELLDELGIMVRLDDAAQEYATQLGTTVENLTQYQKRQAFVNAVISEGQKSFAGIAQAIDPNAYDQLGAALQDLLKNFVTLINKALAPLARFFSKSTAGLVGGIILFASTIRGALLPGLTQGAQRMANFAAESKAAAAASFGNVQTTGKLPEIYTKVAQKIKDGTATAKDFTDAQNSLSGSLRKHNSDLEKNANFQDTSTTKYAKKIVTINEVENAQRKLNNTLILSAQAETANAKAAAINSAAQLDLAGTIKNIRVAMALYRVEIATTAAANGGATASFVGLKTAIFGASLSFKALGVALLTAMPFLAMIPLVFGGIKAAWDNFFGDSTVLKKQQEIFDSLEHINEVGMRLNKTLLDIELRKPPTAGWDEFTAKLTAAAGVSAQIRDRVQDAVSAQIEQKALDIATALEKVKQAQKNVDDAATNVGLANVYGSLQVTLLNAENNLKKLKETYNEIEVEPLIAGLEKALIKSQALGDDPRVTQQIQRQIEGLEKLKGQAKVTAVDVGKVMRPPSSGETTLTLLESFKAGLASFSEEYAKFSAKVSTPFDKMSAGLDETIKALNQTQKVETVFGTYQMLTKEARTLRKELEKGDTPLGEFAKKFKKGNETGLQTIERVNAAIKKQIKLIQETPGKIAEQKAELAKINEARKFSGSIAEKALEIEDKIIDLKAEELQARMDVLKVLNLTEDKTAEILKLEADITANNAKRKSPMQKELEILEGKQGLKKLDLAQDQKALDLSKSQLAMLKKTAEEEARARNRADPMRGFNPELNAKDRLKIEEDLKEKRKDIIDDESAIILARHNMEYALLEAKRQFLVEQAAGDKDLLTSLEKYGVKLETMRTQGVTDIEKNRLAQRASVDAEILTGGDDVRSEILGATGGSTAEIIMKQNEKGGFAALENLTDRITAVRNALNPMLEDLKKLGPEGEVAAAVFGGAMQMTGALSHMNDVFTATGENAASMPEKVTAAMGAVVAGLSMISSIMQASSNARIAAIDKEIAAEQKRDGKSKESVARIAQLEKKKEAQKKKAFEAQKKMQMAMIVANTAMAISAAIAGAAMSAMGTGPFAWKTLPLFTKIMVGLVAAMGAASLAMVAGTSYGGGGSVSAPSTPGSISAGSRRESVDMARSQSASGELAYFRGERGIGGPENFRPAFYGRKSRAMGGNTGYIVGEQGPELFMPDRPGTIVPADDTAQMGAPMTANINITALDASGVEEILTEQQGNIIGMLREAANSYGQDFFEGVDETIYSTPVARRA